MFRYVVLADALRQKPPVVNWGHIFSISDTSAAGVFSLGRPPSSATLSSSPSSRRPPRGLLPWFAFVLNIIAIFFFLCWRLRKNSRQIPAESFTATSATRLSSPHGQQQQMAAQSAAVLPAISAQSACPGATAPASSTGLCRQLDGNGLSGST